MSNPTEQKACHGAEYYLDITGDVCPMTFVRAKLLIERMPAGGRATIRLKGAEPLANVPRAVRDHGHEIVALDAEGPKDTPDGIYRLTVRKAAG